MTRYLTSTRAWLTARQNLLVDAVGASCITVAAGCWSSIAGWACAGVSFLVMNARHGSAD